MLIRRRNILDKFCSKHARARKSVSIWIQICQSAEWNNFSDVKRTFNSVDKNGEDLIFNIGGNNFRLIAIVEFEEGILTVKKIMTHAEYDKEY